MNAITLAFLFNDVIRMQRCARNPHPCFSIKGLDRLVERGALCGHCDEFDGSSDEPGGNNAVYPGAAAVGDEDVSRDELGGLAKRNLLRLFHA